jgi:RNA-directed DNA polymerase
MTTAVAKTSVPHPSVGAVPDSLTTWHQIPWCQVERNVRRLQVRIAQATQQGRWGKVKALQRLLTHSGSAKALAVRRVTENTGKRTPGVDGVTWPTPEDKMQAIGSLHAGGYQPQPLRRVYIPKKNGKMRPLGIPTMRDRAMQVLYGLALDPVAETTADPNSYGFRSARSTADAIEACFIALCRKDRATWILEGDIKACFDGISHDWLLAHIPMDKAILRKWLKAGYLDRRRLYPTTAGTPQGGPISPTLANMALDGLETLLATHFPHRKGDKVNLIRYADDFCVTGISAELLHEAVQPLIETFLAERGLQLSAEKTVITPIQQGFDFLGQTIRRYRWGKRTKYLITPSKKSIKAFLETVRDRIRHSGHLTAGELIDTLNPLIRGWALYHRHVVSKAVFHAVDHTIFQALWSWAYRRHRNKTRWWIKAKYFSTVGANRWVFTGVRVQKGQPVRMTHVFRASTIRIERHRKLRAPANPYDPSWEEYFEKRLDLKMTTTLRGRRHLLYLWKEQKGICPVCRQKITTLTGWHSHHMVWRSQGGSDDVSNRLLLHPACHHQLHCAGLTVEKPRRVAPAEREA